MKKGDILLEETKQEEIGGVVKKREILRLPKAVVTGLASLVAFASVATFAGCGENVEPVVNEPPEIIVNIPGFPMEPISEILTILHLSDNFSCKEEFNDGRERDFYYDDQKMIIEENGTKIYFDDSQDIPYRLYYGNYSQTWLIEKNVRYDTDSVIYDKLRTVSWSAYDEDTKAYTGEYGEETVTLKISDDKTGLTVQWEDYRSVVYDIGTTVVEIPTLEELNMQSESVPVEKVNQLLESLKSGNYKYTKTEDGVVEEYLFDGDAWKVVEGQDAKEYYYFVENNVPYVLTFDSSDGLWHKSETIAKDVDDFVYDDLSSAEWNSYDEDTQVLSGTVGGEEITLEFTSTGATIRRNGIEERIENVGKISVELPDESMIYNENQNVPVEEEKLYTINSNGEYVFDIPAMVDVLNEKTTNGTTWISDYYKNLFIAKNRTVDEIIFINPSLTNLEIGIITNGYKRFDVISNETGSWERFMEDASNNSIEKFKNYLNADTKPFNYGDQIVFEYSTENADSTELAEFNQMTKNILTKIAEIGIQVSSVNDPGRDNIPEYENAEMLFGFKTPAGGTGIGADLGNSKSWNHYYILNVDGKLEFVSVSIKSSIDRVSNEKENVINGNDDGYVINEIERKEIDQENQELYKKNSVQATATAYYTTGKEREL